MTLPDLSVKDVAAALGLNPDTIYMAVRSGELRAFRPPGVRSWRISEADVRVWLGRGENSRVLDEAHGSGSPSPAAPASRRASTGRPSFRDLARKDAA